LTKPVAVNTGLALPRSLWFMYFLWLIQLLLPNQINPIEPVTKKNIHLFTFYL